MERFQAFRVHGAGPEAGRGVDDVGLEDLSPGAVVVRVQWSAVNYKDALAGTGRGRVVRRFPLVPGVDLSGTVVSSDDPRFREGDPVLATGFGLGVDHDGGFAAYCRVPAEWLVPLPEGLSLRDAMVLGTAGFTAALALRRMESNGQSPGMGPILVTGASGGVGSMAVAIFAQRGFEVVGVSRKPEVRRYLEVLGASQVLVPEEAVAPGTGPLASARWGGVVDNVGGGLLAEVLRAVHPWGNVACIGLAGGTALHTTVLPLILRGVSLLGIDSSAWPAGQRRAVWEGLAGELRPAHLDRIAAGEVGLQGLAECFDAVLAGRHTGRTLVRLA